MRPIFLLLLLLFLSSFEQGCAVYDGAAYFHASGKLLDVTIDKNLDSKMAYAEARGADGLICSGALRTTHPVRGWLRWWTCKGESGKLFLACNDGRHFLGMWSSETCSNGYAAGSDQYGNTFVLAYGESREEMLARVGAGPGPSRTAFADGPTSPLYGAMLNHHSNEGNENVFLPAQGERRQNAALRSVAGFFASPDGRIVTAAQGLGKDDKVGVYLPARQREIPARILDIDREGNIAVLKVEATGSVGEEVRVVIHKARLGEGPKAF